MDLQQALSLVPHKTLRIGLKDNEESIVGEVRGPVLALTAAYRIAASHVYRNSGFPDYRELPPRIRMTLGEQWADGVENPEAPRLGVVNKAQYRAIVERMEGLLIQAAELFVGLTPGLACPFECEDAGIRVDLLENPAERDRRVLRYRKQNARIERTYHITRPASRRGPAPRPIRAKGVVTSADGREVVLDREFPSARRAAEFLRGLTAKMVRRSDIRTAVKSGHRCMGLEWSYVQTTVERMVAVAA